jgi:hypothetical protein
MILDLRQGLARELLEFRVAAVLDLLSEQRRISFLVLDLAVYIVPVEGSSVFDGVTFFRCRIAVSASATGIWLVTIRWA